MKHIHSFLQQKNHTPILDKKDTCIGIFNTYTKKVFTREEISFSHKKVLVKCSFEKKHLLMLHKKEILELYKNTPELSFYTDIV